MIVTQELVRVFLVIANIHLALFALTSLKLLLEMKRLVFH